MCTDEDNVYTDDDNVNIIQEEARKKPKVTSVPRSKNEAKPILTWTE